MTTRNVPPPNHEVAQQLVQHVHHLLPIYGPPTHPGEMLLHEFLIPWGMTQMELARRIGVSYPRVNEIVKGKRGITPDTALRLARLFNMTAEFWLGLQEGWDVWHALHADTAADILKIEPMPKGRIYEEGEDDDDETAPIAAD
ncbi:MAG TPA: HigA family addiction module antitoxin [Longimicrobium sp.]|nr:HigA family addiction module antitoxin [Longimicrobium sp.]